ncbi:MAG: hypothetical protein OEW52_10375, partial [Thermoleophilia bacterium]|nr:hypothetical protein [Thermoleophilia bacterium]
MKIVLRAEGPYWLGDTADEQAHDPCAHGSVTLAIDETLFAGPPETDGTNVTGAGLFLLRTLSYSHTHPDWLVTEGEDDNQLLAHCASPLPSSGTNDEFAVYVAGCPYGVNVEVLRDDGTVVIRRDERSAQVTAEDWRTAVLSFCEAVEAFYETSPPRLPLDANHDEWEPFWQEWNDRKRM